jgi:hypothetical protein
MEGNKPWRTECPIRDEYLKEETEPQADERELWTVTLV